jgi:DNA-binding response OmpR family regulator
LVECETSLPDLVILDTMLPDVGGAAVCRLIKSRWPQTVVLQISAARGSARDRVDALEGGADAFMVEPIDPDELLAYTKALLRMRNAEQGERRVNEHLEELVSQRTQDLAETNVKLEIEIRERQKAEEMLHHAQKLEALGQLTGGIAHDLNNVLAVIQSSLGLVRAAIEGRRKYPADKLTWIIGSAEAAAAQGAKAIKQMLAFARRGTFASEVVIIDKVVAGCEAYLRRAVTEAVTVQIVNPGDLWPTRVDPVQLEASLLNLAANSRDAMSKAVLCALRRRISCFETTRLAQPRLRLAPMCASA